MSKKSFNNNNLISTSKITDLFNAVFDKPSQNRDNRLAKCKLEVPVRKFNPIVVAVSVVSSLIGLESVLASSEYSDTVSIQCTAKESGYTASVSVDISTFTDVPTPDGPEYPSSDDFSVEEFTSYTADYEVSISKKGKTLVDEVGVDSSASYDPSLENFSFSSTDASITQNSISFTEYSGNEDEKGKTVELELDCD